MPVVGERPDVASIITELTKASDGEIGSIQIALVDAAGGELPPGTWLVSYAPSVGRRR